MNDDSVASPLENTGSRSSVQTNPFAIENIPSSPENTLSNSAEKQSSEDNDKTSQHSQAASSGFSDSNPSTAQGTLDDDSLFENEPSVELSTGQRALSNSSTQSRFSFSLSFEISFHAKFLYAMLSYADT